MGGQAKLREDRGKNCQKGEGGGGGINTERSGGTESNGDIDGFPPPNTAMFTHEKTLYLSKMEGVREG